MAEQAQKDPSQIEIPERLPLLPIRDIVVFPYMVLPLFVGREMSVKAIEAALAGNRTIMLAAQRSLEVENPTPQDIHPVGTVGMVMRMLKLPDERIKILVQGLAKARIEEFVQTEPYFEVRIRQLPEVKVQGQSLEGEALMRTVKEQLERLVSLGKVLMPDVMVVIENLQDPGRLADMIVSNLGLKVDAAQEVLEIQDPIPRLRRVSEFLAAEIEVLSMQQKIQAEAKGEMDKTQREYFLREQLKAIQKELGELDERAEEVAEFRTNIKDAKMKGPILCFVGPPGVGKTSLGKSIARALGREFVRISLGGIRDEAEIRGHRRTYVGAMPGRIIQGIKQAGSSNPVFMMDEVDKVGADFRGDPSAALLEVLDPEQNHAFSDHYLGVPFDLSEVMFITTANLIDPILSALRDRMEIIEIPGYSEEEKLGIAKRFLIPRQLTEHGLTEKQIAFTDRALHRIINEYTREAGVRNLEREIANVMRKVVKQIAEGDDRLYTITPASVPKYLGVPKHHSESDEKKDLVGVATGLAWTESGGDIIHIEATIVKGKGALTLTGHLGDVMKESAQAALSYVRSRDRQLGIKPGVFAKYDIHIHVPAGAIPKDGPSAGITVATALASALTNTPVRHDIAMTGEVTLRGRVLQIGGLKEKILAAKRVGIFKVILPKKNEKDLADIPKHLLKGMTFIFAETMDAVLGAALRRVPARPGAHAQAAVPSRRSTMSRRPVAAAPSKRH